MAIIRYRNEKGIIKEVVCLKGDKGDKGDPGEGGGVTNAKDLFYDGADEYINATNVEEALKKTSDAIIGMVGDISNKADYIHTHEANDINKVVFVDGVADPVAHDVGGAIDYIFNQLGGVETALDSIISIQESLIGGAE